ncbi:hypothetical protein CYLTODRAFT_489198 [Cylindrobasidium torrendii FP15055 ss-10]|uniref:Vacuolar protein sorting-associated protein 51 homolog n=1 Tax=Cylindrobasidium torrendii FP15055 ss-10 TaxID=1314674 RepID=A0A0D7BEZ3_9AGAR|nr:hypothetical protein CYLTODRAFT_489198 [Cylindrobasidium torrendii FP15055 ss-10]
MPQTLSNPRRASIPRPPPSPSPLRPNSPPSTIGPLSPATPTGPPLTARRPTPSSPPPKSKARDLLRKHYGLGASVPPLSRSTSLDPMNMDSPSFDAKAYYDQLITTATLHSLIKQDNDLTAEIRELGSERQALVYNHHHELIAASDTIAAVKNRADSLEGDLDLLKAAFSEISRLAEEVNIESNA